MKKYVLILILFNLTITALAAEGDSLAIIQAWELTDDFSTPSPAEADTGLIDFQVFYPNP